MGAGAEPDGSGDGARSEARRTVEDTGQFQPTAVEGSEAESAEQAKRVGPRTGSLGRKGGGRPLTCHPDETVTAKAAACAHCQSALTDADQVLHGRYDKIDLPVVRPMVTRVERYAGHCPCCGGVTLAAIPASLQDGSPFSINIVALAIYLRFTHAISYRRLTQMFQHLYALQISEGALDAMLQRAKPCFDSEVAAILARLRRSRIVCSDETSVRIDGRTHWNWVFQNDQVVIHVVRNSRAANVITETMAGHRPSVWVSDLYGAQQGHADLWQVCLAHQLRDCKYAIEAGDTIFAPRMKALLLRAVVLARRRKRLAESTRRTYQARLDHELNATWCWHPPTTMAGACESVTGRCAVTCSLFSNIPMSRRITMAASGNATTATYRKVTGGFRSTVGCRPVRRRSIRRRNRSATRKGCVSGNSRSPRRGIRHSARLSRYSLGKAAFASVNKEQIKMVTCSRF